MYIVDCKATAANTRQSFYCYNYLSGSRLPTLMTVQRFHSDTYHESTFDQWEKRNFAAIRDKVFLQRPALKVSIGKQKRKRKIPQ